VQISGAIQSGRACKSLMIEQAPAVQSRRAKSDLFVRSLTGTEFSRC
jgi:hypothetical protein